MSGRRTGRRWGTGLAALLGHEGTLVEDPVLPSPGSDSFSVVSAILQVNVADGFNALELAPEAGREELHRPDGVQRLEVVRQPAFKRRAKLPTGFPLLAPPAVDRTIGMERRGTPLSVFGEDDLPSWASPHRCSYF